MHVISRKALLAFAEQHPDCDGALRTWYRVITTNGFNSLVALRQSFPSADLVGDKIVFNIGGNKVRLIAVVHFNRQKVYIRDVLTHAEYDQGRWK